MTRDHAADADAPARAPNGAVDRRLRFLASFAGAVAAVVLFAWASQARQDARIAANEKAVAVIETKLDAICEKLDEIREALAARR